MFLIIKDFILNYYINFKFIFHNKKFFPKNSSKKKGEILVEFNAFHPSHIAISYLSNFLKNKTNSKINSFYNYAILVSDLNESLFNKFKWFISNILSLNNFSIYRSFGVDKIFKPIITSEIKIRSDLKHREIFEKINNKEDILKIKIDGVLCGDLIYDTYLKKYKEKTVDIKDKKFSDLLRDFISLFYFWSNYLKKEDVKAIIGVHSVYTYAIPLRLGIKNNIPTYAINPQTIYNLKKNMMRMYGDFEYHDKFVKLPQVLQKKGRIEAKKKLDKRLSGITGIEVDLLTTTQSSFSEKKYENLIIKNSKKKILICTHDFQDSVHAYGDMIFPDFFDWIEFLANLAKRTDYDWYIKNHPTGTGRVLKYQYYTKKVIDEFINENPQFKLLPDEYPHKKIVESGIDCVLTGYGSVGVEYALLGVPVINASINNPHKNYNFNLHPKDLNEYEKLLTNLDKINLKIDKNEIYEFYFMRHIFADKDWLIKDRKEMLKKIDGYDNLFTYKMYKYWLSNFNDKHHLDIMKKIENFIISDDLCLNIINSGKKI